MPAATVQIPAMRYRPGMAKFDLTKVALEVDNPSGCWDDLALIYQEIGQAGDSAAFRRARSLTIMPVQLLPRQELVALMASTHVLQRRRTGGVRLDTYVIGRTRNQHLVLSELTKGGEATIHIYRPNGR